jgi:APA family basic amino acid/polyamine antiporter
VTPAVFLLVTGFMMYYLLTQRPLQAMLGTMVMIAGLLIYLLAHRRTGRTSVVASPGRE